MLFNHLSFSDLPDRRLQLLVESKVYRGIVRHRMFNPRVVENISREANSRSMSDDAFIQFVMQEFDDASSLWKHAFLSEIRKEARQVLALLWTGGGSAEIESLRNDVISLNAATAPEEVSLLFDDAVRQLDGNFISIDRYADGWRTTQVEIVSFDNPSVEEFVQGWLASQPDFIVRLVSVCVNMQQIQRLADRIRRYAMTGRRDVIPL